MPSEPTTSLRSDPWRLAAGLVSLALCLSAAAAIPASLLAAKPLWFMLGFEVAILLATVFGVLIGMGRYAQGPALGLACVVAVVAVGSLLGDQSAKLSNPLAGRILLSVRSVDVTMFLAVREMGAAMLGVCAAGLVLRRRPRESLRSLAVGLGTGAVLMGLLGAAWAIWPRVQSIGAFGRTMVGFALAVAALGLLAASVHWLVRAFQLGRLAEPGGGPAGASA